MNRLTSLGLLLFSLAPLPAQENGIDQDLELVTYPSGEKVIAWYGHVGRSYFVQASVPTDHLNKWTWAPIIEGGDDKGISHEVNGTAEKGFFRLQYTDQVPGPNETLDTADFDGDGISNKDEVEPGELLAPTNPLNPDTDGDGMPDGWERNHGLDPNDNADAANLFTGSSVTNLEAFNSGVQADPNATPTNKDGDGAEDIVDADPNDKVVDWAPSAEASYAVIELEQEDYSGYQYSLEPEASNWLQPNFSASIDSTGMVLWNDMNQANGSTAWSGRHRVWISGVWSYLMSGNVTNTTFDLSTSYVFDEESNTTKTVAITVNPSSPSVKFVSGGYAIGYAGYSGTVWGLEHWVLLGWDENDQAIKEQRYDMTVSAGANPVATLWSSQSQQGVINWQVNPIAPPTNLYTSQIPLSPLSFQSAGVCAVGSPGGAIAVLGGNMTIDGRKWKGWSPPSVPGTDSPTWESPYVNATTGRCLQINAIEDGGSMAGVSWDSSSGWWQMNDRRLLVIEGGAEQELPSGTGQSPHVYGLCRVYVGNSSDSRLVAAGSNLWVKQNGQWHVAEHTPEVGQILAVAKDGVLLGGHSIWRNGKEVELDKLVEKQKVGGPESAARYTNIRGYAMNADGAIVALADDALQTGTGKKTLLLLVPFGIEEVISDQISGNEANKLPTAYFGGNPAKPGNGHPNNPMLMATRSGSDARLMIKMNVPAAQAASIRVGVRQTGQTTILSSVASVPPPGKTPLSFTALSGSTPTKLYEVVAGYDANINAVLENSEVAVVFEKTPRKDREGNTATTNLHLLDKFIVVTLDDFTAARAVTDGYGTGTTINTFFPTAAKMIAGFARGATTITGSSPPESGVLLDASTIPSLEGLSHPLGGKWNAAKQTSTHRLVLPTGSDLSEDVVGSTGLRDMYARALWNHRATIAAGATTSWGVVKITFIDKDIDFSASDTNDQVHAALGKCNFVGSLEVSCKLKAGGVFDVGALNCYGAMVDLYDFAFGASKVTVLGIDIADPKEAARTQAGFATLTFSPWPDAGRVFFTKVELGTGWFDYTGSYPP